VTSAVTGPVQADATSAAAGTAVTATATCPLGTVLLSGGASVTTSAGTQLQRVSLVQSAPVAPNQWRGTAMTIQNLTPAASNRARVQVWVVCTA
jgi:hypothetical protein